MIRRDVLGWLAAAALLLTGGVTAQTPPPVPPAPPPPAAEAPRIIAIGDLHGDWPAWRAIAAAAGVIDAAGNWSGGRTILVQTGDVPDRGPDTLKISDDLMRLQQQAPATGGRVVTLVGNHEAMNITNDLRYVDPGEYAAFADRKSAKRRKAAWKANEKAIVAAYRARDPQLSAGAIEEAWLRANPLGKLEHRAAWAPTGRIGKWVIANPAVALIDGNIFVHGGIGPKFASVPIDEINRRVAASLTAQEEAETAIVNDPDGPLWFRGYSTDAKAADATAPTPPELDAMLTGYGARRIVVGHTPFVKGIAVDYGGRLVHIDTGASRYYKGVPSWLEIRGDVLTAHPVPRPAAGTKTGG